MEIQVSNILVASTKPEAIIVHKEKKISFLINGIIRKAAEIEYDVFEYINKYWQTLSEPEQDAVFESYKRIRSLFSTIINKSELARQLNLELVKLLNFHDFQRMHDWVVFYSDIRIPDNFAKQYTHNYDQQGSREQTYIRSDYTKLIAMILILKTAIPVWGEFMNQGKDDAGTLFKEYYAFQLLNGADIMISEAMQKLDLYVKHAIADKNTNASAIKEGISSEDFPFWMLSQLIIHRLSIGDIRGLDPKANIVTYIYKYISQKNQFFETNNEKAVRDKSRNDYDGVSDDKISSLERYKIKHDISLGEIVEIAFSIRDLHQVAWRLDPTLPKADIDRSLETVQKLNNFELKMPQLNILRWLFAPVVSSKGLLYLDKQIIVNCLGVAEAILFHNGFDHLAVLLTGIVPPVDDQIYISSTDSRARIPKDIVDQLNKLYPFQRYIGGKKTGYKPVNPAIETIDLVAQQFSQYSWVATAHGDHLERIFGLRENPHITIPYDIKIILARYVLFLGSRQKTAATQSF